MNDFCILCGKEAVTVDDLCSDCHMAEFDAQLERPEWIRWICPNCDARNDDNVRQVTVFQCDYCHELVPYSEIEESH